MNDALSAQQSRLFLVAVPVLILCQLWLVLGVDLLRARWRRQARPRWRAPVFGLLSVVGLGGLGWGLLVEPDWLQVTRVEVVSARLPPGARLRIVHLSDLHVDGWTRALERLPDAVNALQPDLLVFTGDSLNAAGGLPVLREVLSRVETRQGRFAVQGNHDVAYGRDLDLFGGGVARELTGEAWRGAEGHVVLCGAAFGDPGRITECLRANPQGLRIVAYHTPDLVEDLAPLEPDLYLAGHTHGGQVRLPFYGALLTMSRFDKAYEMGLYQVRRTALFVSRGIGVEPHAPRIRFLCRPEIAVIDVVGAPGQAEM